MLEYMLEWLEPRRHDLTACDNCFVVIFDSCLIQVVYVLCIVTCCYCYRCYWYQMVAVSVSITIEIDTATTQTLL